MRSMGADEAGRPGQGNLHVLTAGFTGHSAAMATGPASLPGSPAISAMSPLT
jgi:hypothetical protein